MRLELFVLGITAFFVYNTYKDGKYTKMLLSFKKYYKMLFYVSMGVGLYILMKRNPAKGRDLLFTANNFVRMMPFDRSAAHMLSPVIDFTCGGEENSFMQELNGMGGSSGMQQQHQQRQGGGLKPTKRSVSETKKKYVASGQGWKCESCQKQLDHTFEIDHRVRLEYGGTNDADNLVALCRNCHGLKTASENM